jgi:phosphoribosylaminoimidazolecarboxamide formyltransferase/IMP cyclohydrolase
VSPGGAGKGPGAVGGARIAVLVSGTGSNLRALHAAEQRGLLGGAIELVLADRECPGLAFAREAGLDTALVTPSEHPERAAWDAAIAAALQAARIDLVVLAGFMRVLGPAVVGAWRGRMLNVHPSLLPAYPGRHPVADALAGGTTMTGVTVHLVDETLDGGPIVAQRAVPVLPGDDEASLAARIHAAEHQLLPRCVAIAAAGGLRVADGHVVIDAQLAASLPRPRRALLSMSDKRGLVEFGRGLAELGFELVSTGGTARALREAGLAVTDVAGVTGSPEMLDGRVKTLHPAIEAGILADLRRSDHRAQLSAAAFDPFEVVAVNLYPFEEAAARPDITLDELIEEIDVGGPTMVRAAAKNHASVAIVTDAADHAQVLRELRDDGSVSEATRRRLAVAAFRLTAAYDAAIAGTLGGRLLDSPAPAAGADAVNERLPAHLGVLLDRAALLRYGENPHQAAALYVLPGADPGSGLLAGGAQPLQGKELSYNNLLDAAAAAGLARELRGPAVAIIKHGNPCGAAEATDLLHAWELALSGDPASAFGGVVAVRGTVDGPLAERLASMFLEVVLAAAFDPDARRILATRVNLRLLQDPGITQPAIPSIELRSAGGAVLATDADVAPDDAAAWRLATSRAPSAAERADLELAWRVCRHVHSNAIVLVRDGALVGVGAGQMSRVDSATLAVMKAGAERARGAACASDAFYPFPDAVEVCLAAGISAYVQPGGSQRDAEVINSAERAGATMLLTGVRHFRH